MVWKEVGLCSFLVLLISRKMNLTYEEALVLYPNYMKPYDFEIYDYQSWYAWMDKNWQVRGNCWKLMEHFKKYTVCFLSRFPFTWPPHTFSSLS